MGRVRLAARSGYFFLVLIGAAALPITSNAADEPHQRNVHPHVHHSGLVHRRVQARPIALEAAPAAAVRLAAQLPDEQSTIIVTSSEPGAVVTSTKAAPNTSEPAKPEPETDNPAKLQAHGPRGWLIQIGAFDLETEARRHLSEAQLNASAALAAADPFTERVQRGDKVLYRARFAGFDKEAAEIACKQLKRGHFECMAIKD